MEIDYIFPCGIFSFKKLARAKILTAWKTAFRVENAFTNNKLR